MNLLQSSLHDVAHPCRNPTFWYMTALLPLEEMVFRVNSATGMVVPKVGKRNYHTVRLLPSNIRVG